MNFSQRSYQSELLDDNRIPFSAIRQNMIELNTINTYLGGHAITLKGVQSLWQGQTSLHICEIGCGGGDNLAAIVRWAKKKSITLTITGIDINEHCIEVARQKTDIDSSAQWITSDYRDVVFTTSPDIIFSSLFCHHFTDELLINQLQWMHQHSKTGFFINDLHRHWLAYYSIKIITGLFSHSYLVKNDAPLSVARGFIKEEWEALLKKAAIDARISWQWAFRFLIISQKNGVVA